MTRSPARRNPCATAPARPAPAPWRSIPPPSSAPVAPTKKPPCWPSLPPAPASADAKARAPQPGNKKVPGLTTALPAPLGRSAPSIAATADRCPTVWGVCQEDSSSRPKSPSMRDLNSPRELLFRGLLLYTKNPAGQMAGFPFPETVISLRIRTRRARGGR